MAKRELTLDCALLDALQGIDEALMPLFAKRYVWYYENDSRGAPVSHRRR